MIPETAIKYTDAIFLMIGILFVILLITEEPPKSLEYVPDAVQGLTTLASILIGFTGFYLSHTISTTEEEETKKWLKRRIAYITFFIVIGLFILASAYTDLVSGELASSIKAMKISLVIITILFLDTFFILSFEKLS